MEIGRIMFFSDLQGYGYIQTHDGKEVYFNASALQERSLRLTNGVKVCFDLFQTALGLEATNVRLMPNIMY